MRIITTKDYNEMSQKAAAMVISHVTLKPNTVLGLATGDSPIGMYREIIKSYENNEIDLSEVVTFNLDEYYGLNLDNEQSYHYFMMTNFFNYINIAKNNIHILDGEVTDIDKECTQYEEKIKKAGGIDLQILGIGVNGHIGFNEPDVNFEAETHLVNLDENTIQANSRFFNSIKDVPTKALSMGIKTIMQSRKIVLLASGSNKASAIAKAVNGKICPEVPASILQLHPDVTLIIDASAKKMLY